MELKRLVGKILCFFGKHKWKAVQTWMHFSSNVKDIDFVCVRCGLKGRSTLPIRGD